MPENREILSDQSVFDRDPCDGCDGTCGDVCPVMEAQRHALERVQSRSEIRRDAVMDPVGLAHRHAEVVIERDRLRAEVTHLKEEQVAFVRALEKAQAENERLRDALTSARALVGVVHVIDPRKGHSVHVPAEDDFYWVSDGVHTEDCSACALERTIDAALALGSDDSDLTKEA